MKRPNRKLQYDKCIEVLERYENWEANLIMDENCWEDETPKLSNKLYEELLEIQNLRNEVLSTKISILKQQLK